MALFTKDCHSHVDTKKKINKFQISDILIRNILQNSVFLIGKMIKSFSDKESENPIFLNSKKNYFLIWNM